MTSDETPGIDQPAVSAWLDAHMVDGTGPWRYELIAAGGSNLTFRLTDSMGQLFALRRPPVGSTLATAHDTGREWRIMDALASSGSVPVPSCLARCDDVAVTGAPFYVMSFVDGRILRTSNDAAALDPAEAEAATDALISTQVALHTLDLDDVGLADLGRHDGYVERQLRRWMRQVERAAARDVPLIGELHASLAASIPREQVRPALAHGDYRFDNVVLAEDCSMAAVLDWELCTTGDPIADFAWSLQYWADPDDDVLSWLTDPPTIAPAFPRRAAVAERYSTATGFDLSDLPFYEAFSWWKQACIVEGVYARRLAGSRGGMQESAPVSSIADRVDAMLDHAHDLVRSLD